MAPYFRSLPLFPAYAFGDERIDGLVPACRVESWEKFIEAMRSPDHNRAKAEIIYRGQRGHNWHLSSTLARLFDGGSVPPQHEASLLGQFRLAMRGRGLDVSGLDEQEIWAFGQHHGLRTPLIDWTKSPYVALFFAFDEPDLEGVDNPSRAVFCLNMTAIRADESLSEIIFEPTHHENARLVNQAGLFTITPSGRDNLVSAILNELIENEVIDPSDPMDVSRFIAKIHIPNEHRVECLNTLRKMNIHHANLFPDPGGASKYCNDWLARVIEEERHGELEAQVLEQRRLRTQAEDHEQQRKDVSAPLDSQLITAGEISAEVITQLLQNMLGPGDKFSADLLTGWAPKIINLYERVAGLDWPERDAVRANLKLEFRKFLLSNSVNKSVAEACALQLLDLFESNWRKVNNRPHQ
ncbi:MULTISPECIES: FRG domain-containing protein [unclassified Bradyrhizobium]|uniref:FRG domain-containing protein n=1 Tax=unclassified Bradyrhizobium TaxID=2631580 RepID=UPI0028E1E56B|nr:MULTISPECIES: FRG domain-containing protein [unclassified Bradyrhizobium]